MSDVTVIFAGVLLLGPGRPKNEPYERPGPFYAISPPCTRRRTARTPDSDTYGYIPFHLPAIVTSAKPAEGSRPPDDCLTSGAPSPLHDEGCSTASPPGSTKHYIWYPFRERLEFVIDGNPSGTIKYEHSNGPYDVDLVSDMRRVWPEVSSMPRATTDPAVDPRTIPSVHGQVFVPGGTVRGKGSKKLVVFEPPRTPYPIECDIVPEAEIIFTAEHRIDILCTSLDTGSRLDTISFDVNGNMEIRVENGDPKDIRLKTLDSEYSPHDADRDRADVDFELFYTILAPNDRTNLPVPRDLDLAAPLVRDCYVTMTDGRTG
jgi:hypothetical protein